MSISHPQRRAHVIISAMDSTDDGGKPLGNSENLHFQIPRNLDQKKMTGDEYHTYLNMIKDE
jgi:hypothetical protein